MTTDSSDDGPGSGRAALVEALAVRRYARIAVAFAAVFAVAVAVYFVVVVSGGRTEAPLGYYPALAFVVFVTTAMLAVVVLVSRRVLALAVHPAAIVRKGATGGLLAGVLWLAAANALFLGPGQPWATAVDIATPWAPLLTSFGLWAVYTRYKRTAPFWPAAPVATVVALGGALALADLAAASLLSVLPDVGPGVDQRTVSFVRGSAALLVGGQTALAVLAALGDDDVAAPLLVAIPPLVGLAGLLLLDTGRAGLGVFAAGMAVSWLLASWQLRAVTDAAVPVGPELLESVADSSGDSAGDSSDAGP